MDLYPIFIMNIERKIRKKIMSQIKGFWAIAILSFISIVLIQILSIIPPIFMQRVIDVYIPNKDIKKTFINIFIFVGVPIISSALSTCFNYMINTVGRKSGQKLTVWAFERIIQQSMDFFSHNNTSEVIAYCKTEANKYVMMWLYDIPSAIASIISGLVIFAIIFNYSNFIAMIIVISIPFGLVPCLIISKKLNKTVEEYVDLNAKTTQIMEDSLRGIRFIKSMALEKKQISKLNMIYFKIVKLWSKIAALDNLNGIWTNGLTDNLFYGLIFLSSSLLVMKSELSIGSLVVIIAYIPKIYSILSHVTTINFSFQKQVAEYNKLFHLIELPIKEESLINKKRFVFNKKIEFRNVEFFYSSDCGKVLNKVSFAINKGEWVGVIGSNGAGKSTLFDIILRFYEPKSGEVLIDGYNYAEISESEIRKNVTLVSQNVFLFPGSIRDNLLMCNENISEDELWDVISKVGLKKKIESLQKGLDTYIGENGIQLSGGERQKVALAQGLIRKSKIILLDEVTSNIDTVSESEIKNSIKTIKDNCDITIVSISHSFDFLEFTDFIIEINNGNICSIGKYDDLILENRDKY